MNTLNQTANEVKADIYKNILEWTKTALNAASLIGEDAALKHIRAITAEKIKAYNL